MPRIFAPFTPEQVAILNRFQTCGVVHPFTCAIDSGHPPLVADVDGWHCPACAYTQIWAHDFMADASYVQMFDDVRRLFPRGLPPGGGPGGVT